jgi:phosphoribosylamine---glycine ligase
MMRAQTRPTVLIVGKDARTDAIAASCSASPLQPVLFGLTELLIPGLVQKCQDVFTGSLTDVDRLIEIARKTKPDLVIIGPEEPLAAGYADALRELGIPVFGPSKQLAQIESSKAWARQLLDNHHIPGNPEYRLFESPDGLPEYIEELGSFVVKPDGLTAGKGVCVFGEHLQSIHEALDYAEDVLSRDGRVQIEERLEGEEFSLQTITDGSTVIHCPLVQDHKRAFDGDKGPNTGGMGSYSCADFSLPFLEAAEVMEARSINEQVIDALARETGEPYRGVLYGGFIATGAGLRLIEYNSRFGDPEAMNVLPLLNADFVELCTAAAVGELSHVEYTFERKAAVCKYIVPRAYPGSSLAAEKIVVPPADQATSSLRWYWAACRQEGSDVFLTSSRSGAFVGIGDSLEDAEQIAEDAARTLQHSSKGSVRHREDIGRADVIDARLTHMASLRATTARVGALSE